MSLIKADIEQLLDRYKKTYIDNPSVMISGYTQENQIVADYNGRQILELMQNADDAGSDIIHIEIDTQQQTLCISNKGNAFDLGGIESLMFPGISTKNKTEYIGNKGLGFRSILNWVDSVKILTREVSVSFSRKHTEEYFKTHLANEPAIKQRLEQERKMGKIASETLPIATLAFPEITNEVADSDYVTQIKLTYKKVEDEAIEAQLDSISEETLLFLPHSTRIVLVKNGELIKDLFKSKQADGSIKVGEKSWRVYSQSNLAYNENVRFSYTIAWQDDLSDQGMFYTYFPTDVTTDLPCLIHATFDLTNNRKELNKCSENEFILNHIAVSLSKIASTFLKNEIADWRAYKFLTPQNTNNRTFLKPFYSAVLEKRESTSCYPGINNQYINKEKAIYYGDSFSSWVAENLLGDSFEHLIKPAEFEIYLNQKEFQQFSTDEWIQIARTISSKITDHIQRARLIKLLLDDCQLNLNEESKLPLLIGQDYTFEPGTYQENVFAYRSLDQNLNLPSFANITFINSTFYDALLNIFSEKVAQTREGSEDTSRTLIRIIKPVVTLRQNDSNEVVRYIVSELNKLEPTIDKIRSLLSFLLNIYSEKTDRKNKLAFDVPLLNRANQIVNSSQLIFGDDYTKGSLTELIFEGIYDDSKYLATNVILGVTKTDEIDVLGFFSWLGVQHYFISKEEILTTPTTDRYFHFLFYEKKEDKPDNARTNNIELKAEIIKNLKDLKRLEPNKLVLLLEKSQLIRRFVVFSNDTDLNQLTYKYGNAYPKAIHTNYSYIYYQIITQLLNFEQYTLSDDPEFEILFKKINLKDEIFVNNLTSTEIESLRLTLKTLGITESLEDITEDRLKSVIEQQETLFPEGEGSQSFYKKCLEFYLGWRKKHPENNGIDYCDYFFGKKGVNSDSLVLIKKTDLYYSDNYLLPRKILDKFYFINLPKRIGEDNVKDIFGVKLIKDELNAIEIVAQETHQLSIDFNKYIQSLKPFILAYRIEVMKDKTSKQNEAKSIKRLKIELVTELSIKFNSEIITLEENEFIPLGETFYIKTGHKNHISDLLRIPEFCDAIAEVFCISFKISSLKNTFRRVVKDGSSETLHILKTDEKEFLVSESSKLLGINSNEVEFWKKIIPGLEIDGLSSDAFYHLIELALNKNLPEFCKEVDFSNFANKVGTQFLQWVLDNTQSDLAQLIGSTELIPWYKEQVDNLIRDYSQHVRFLLWQKANNGDTELKKRFHQNYLSFSNASSSAYFKLFYERQNFALNPDYKSALLEFVHTGLDINLDDLNSSNIDVENKYASLLQSYSIGIDVEDAEKIIKEDYPEVFSLLFFDGFEEEIESTLKKYKNIDPNGVDEDQGEAEDISVVIITDSSIKASNPRVINNGNNKGSDFAHTSQVSKKKVLAGKKEENKVIKALRNSGYEVNPVSKLTDSKHYDLEYKKPGGEWRFLEVKKDSGGYFFMSKSEKNTALIDSNARRYDIAIVSSNKIHIIESPFLFNNESFEHNSKFYAEPSDYVIYFNLETEINN